MKQRPRGGKINILNGKKKLTFRIQQISNYWDKYEEIQWIIVFFFEVRNFWQDR